MTVVRSQVVCQTIGEIDTWSEMIWLDLSRYSYDLCINIDIESALSLCYLIKLILTPQVLAHQSVLHMGAITQRIETLAQHWWLVTDKWCLALR